MPAAYPVLSLLLAGTAAAVAATLTARGLSQRGFPLPQGARNATIDGLRGYLALSVLLHHFIIRLQVSRLGLTWTAPDINLFNQFGTGAVALFFMITGFLFYPPIQRGWKAVTWRAVLLKRLFRIEPLVILSFVLVSLTVAWRSGRVPDHSFVHPMLQWLTAAAEPALLGDKDAFQVNAGVL